MSITGTADNVVEFFKPAFLVIGILLVALAVGMVVPAAVDMASGNPNIWVFPLSAGITMFTGSCMILANRSPQFRLSVRQAFVMTSLVWIVVTLFGSLPFVLGELRMSFTDAYFEAMSGITTTGSTVITGLDGLSSGILLWRAILQWLGGLGFIVMSISILPMLKVGGMQMFKVEAFDPGEKTMPRTAQISAGISIIYIALTAIWAVALWMAGMTGLEASVHAMTTLATGGYSTSDGSIGHFNSGTIDLIITIGMILGGVPFMLILATLRGRSSSLFGDVQVQWYLGILLFATVSVFGWLLITRGLEPVMALRQAAFSVASVMTGTGFVSGDYSLWGTLPVVLLFFLTFVGGCTGSTACGMKVFRFQVIFITARMELRRIIHPNGVFIPRYNDRPISDEVTLSVLSYFFIFIFSFAALTLSLNMLGLDFTTAITSAATAISNVGPGLGAIVGPSGTFQSLPDAAKWLLAFGMLTGRLEVFTVMVLFSRLFWRD